MIQRDYSMGQELCFMEKIVYYSEKNKNKDSIFFLKKAFECEYGKPCKELLKWNEFGKPFFSAKDSAYFNISHSGKYICCVFDTDAVGIDIQLIKTVPEKIMNGYLHKTIVDPLLQTLEWTRFESYYKRLGSGIPTDKRENHYQGAFLSTEELENYIITINTTVNTYDHIRLVHI